ncbi:tail fiber assembly protein [Pantoea ananatis]|uniref:tail fiber assembly protein n=1 Tax=Pantoea ananas TaxID=553 RepID=UPI000D5CCDEC|nr:tail fiber assembly protein [Pantoea ananatis]PVY84065.1 virus tail fiber assembly protein lambda gpK [Pantoea ananatis]
MIDLKNFKPGKPVSADDIASEKEYGMKFLFDDAGHEWYASQRLYADGTLKIAYDKEGIIWSLSTDVSELWPVHLSVAEIAHDDQSRQIDNSGLWKYIGGKVIKLSPDEDLKFLEDKKEYLIDKAVTKIMPGMAKLLLKKQLSAEESELLEKQLHYLDQLNTLDLKAANPPVWPEWPK